MLIEMRRNHKAMSFFAVTMILATVLAPMRALINVLRSRNDSVATIGSLYVGKREYARALKNYQRYVRSMEDLYRRFSLNIKFDKKNPREILVECADSVLRQDLARKFGFCVGDKVLAEKLREFLAKQSEGNSQEGFDKANYLYSVESQGLTVREFEEIKRKEIGVDILEQVLEAMIIPEVCQTSSAAPKAFDLWAIDSKKMHAIVKKEGVKDAELNAFFVENRMDYKTKPKATISYFKLDEMAMRDLVHADDYEISEYYRIYGAQKFSIPAKYALRVVTVKIDDQKTDAAKELLEKKKADGSKSKTHSLSALEDLKLDPVLSQAVSMVTQKGDWTETLELDGELVAAQIVDYVPSKIRPLEEVKQEVRKAVLDKESLEEARRFVQEIVREAFTECLGLEIVAREAARFGLEVFTADADDVGVTGAKNLSEGQIGCKTGNGQFLIYAVSSLVPEREMELDECREKVVEDFYNKLSQKRQEAALLSIRQALANGQKPSGPALEHKKISMVKRSEAGPAFEKAGLSTGEVTKAWEMVHPGLEVVAVDVEKVGRGLLVLSEVGKEGEQGGLEFDSERSLKDDFAKGIFASCMRNAPLKEFDQKSQQMYQDYGDF